MAVVKTLTHIKLIRRTTPSAHSLLSQRSHVMYNIHAHKYICVDTYPYVRYVYKYMMYNINA